MAAEHNGRAEGTKHVCMRIALTLLPLGAGVLCFHLREYRLLNGMYSSWRGILMHMIPPAFFWLLWVSARRHPCVLYGLYCLSCFWPLLLLFLFAAAQ